MINLLSRNEQKKIYREYLLRIATLVFFHIGIIGTIFTLILVPSYLRLEKEITLVESELKMKQSQLTPDDQVQVAEAKEFLAEIQALRSPTTPSSAVAFVEKILTLKPARVSVLGFQYGSEENGKLSLDIRGRADRREDLLEFKSRLETEGGFTGINLPAQTLIKRTDIQFTINLAPSKTSNTAPSVAPSLPRETDSTEPLP